ncbi:YceI family protein [bacterium]|nr:YceI family protein [bacterium]
MSQSHRIARLFVVTALLVAAVPVLGATYDIDGSHSSVNFQIKHLAISKVNGTFDSFEGSFEFVPGQPDQWSVAATIDAASVNTGNKDRDDHLRNPDFFDVAKYPTLSFKSTSLEMANETEGTLKGELTMHGVTKAVELDLELLGTVTDPWGNERAGFSASGKINRKEWGLTYNAALETGGLVLGEDVKITLEIEGIKRK